MDWIQMNISITFYIDPEDDDKYVLKKLSEIHAEVRLLKAFMHMGRLPIIGERFILELAGEGTVIISVYPQMPSAIIYCNAEGVRSTMLHMYVEYSSR